MSPIDFPDLRPFKSAVFAYQFAGETPPIQATLGDLRKLLKITTTGRRRQRSRQYEEIGEDAWGLLHYSRREPASWTMPDVGEADDITNYLAAVVRHGPWVAITLTEGSRRSTLMKALTAKKIQGLARVPPSVMKSAFVAGKPRTLWLKGTHRRDTVKADNKVLIGPDLRDALDPISDQTYRYTAIRCESPGAPLGDVIGVAVDQGRLWASTSETWDDYRLAMLTALDTLANATPHAAELLPVLALSGADITGVENAFDLGITPPELLTIGPTEDPSILAHLEQLEELAYNTAFDVTGQSGSTTLQARVTRGSTYLGDITLQIAVEDERVEAIATGAIAAPGHSESFETVKRCCETPDMLTIYYESGHSILDGQVCAVRHRDVSFDGFRFADLTGYNVDCEKPRTPAAMGTDGSLFCWTLNQWPIGAGLQGSRGWLLCDDRPGETCDFIHLDLSDPAQPPLLTLIHVKSANSTSAQRQISVVAYETVTGQAIKNLRHLDAGLLAEGVGGAVPSGANPPVWMDGTPSTLASFQAAIQGLGANIRRRIVIIQPHITRTALTTAREATTGADFARRRQLETLLVAARANVQSMSAEFLVVGDDS
jgi:hypothetical protein